jgi:hypothetical protein
LTERREIEAPLPRRRHNGSAAREFEVDPIEQGILASRASLQIEADGKQATLIEPIASAAAE